MTPLHQECRTLKNFYSLHSILAALKSIPIHHVKKMWGNVSRCVGFSHQSSDLEMCHPYNYQCSLISWETANLWDRNWAAGWDL